MMASVEAILQRVRACGERVTIQRRLVIEALCHQGNHLTITDIQRYLQQRDEEHALPDVTVYRVLQWLKELGLVSQTDMGTSGTVYELVSEPFHHHLICLTCGKVTTLDDRYFATLREQIQADHGFSARIEHMAIYGQCADCQRTPQTADTPTSGL
jgi:Fur family ferric uptake transcriptional regulator